ncbi:MAG: PEP-utilizing enzyme [Acidobacteriota bacterium]
MVKRVFRAIGASLARDGVIDAPGDIFHLTVEEIARAARQPPADLRALVDTRKREDAHHRTLSPPPRIVTGSARHETELPPATPGAREIRGIGCAPGIARGPARIIDRPAGEVELLGRILVAPLTDPGWIFLMVAASGLVSERGSILSHTAIVGRELGIPTVVDARGATTLIHDGQPIAIDGRTGIVRLLDP